MNFTDLTITLEELTKTSKRLKKTYILSELLKKVPQKYLEAVLMLSEGRVFPAWDERVLGLSDQTALKIIHNATGESIDTIKKLWSKEGDLGIVTEELMKKRKQMTLAHTTITVEKVFTNLQNVASIEGKGSTDKKIGLVTELLTSATPKEAKYIIKIVLGNLRIGIAEGSIRDAIVWAFFEKEINFKYDDKDNTFEVDRKVYDQYVNATQHALDILNDFSEVAGIAKKEGLKALEKISITPGKPLNVMLFQKAENLADAFKTVGKPAAIEVKYDGMRLLINNDGKKTICYTRRLENVTKQFPEVIEAVKKQVKAKSFILDAEVVGYDKKTGRYLPFQTISQRIKRKYDIEDIAKKYPVEINVFDVLYLDGKSVIELPFKERRSLLKKCVKEKKKELVLAKQIITSDEIEARKFYEEALSEGQEGVMVKNLQAAYKPGSRVGHGVKVKPILEPIDAVIIGAEYGEGKRSTWLSSFKLAVMDENKLVEIGKVGTGIKEKTEGVTFLELTKLLKPLVQEEHGREVIVKAKIILEITYEEIQASPTYNSGYALRFPRVKNLRLDKPLREISTLRDIVRIYKKQRGKEN
ncbi:MAG: ATP-dependent DNA ligase [Nanoarchaeota archaeon]